MEKSQNQWHGNRTRWQKIKKQNKNKRINIFKLKLVTRRTQTVLSKHFIVSQGRGMGGYFYFCSQCQLSLKHLAFISDAVVLLNPIRNIRKAVDKKTGKAFISYTCLHLLTWWCGCSLITGRSSIQEQYSLSLQDANGINNPVWPVPPCTQSCKKLYWRPNCCGDCYYPSIALSRCPLTRFLRWWTHVKGSKEHIPGLQFK